MENEIIINKLKRYFIMDVSNKIMQKGNELFVLLEDGTVARVKIVALK